ncbi:hypothetical protein H0H93_007997 [Arthromyces matolae]|nr:hypothetical protein H0H93_007997 [Arthromyces matolae]
MEGMVRAYMAWNAEVGNCAMESAPRTTSTEPAEGSMKVHVMDIFNSYSFHMDFIASDANILAAQLRHGLLPTAPSRPTFTFSIRVVEFYRLAHLRSPHFTIQPFVKTLCDAHRIPFRPYLSEQFSIAFDVYLSIRAKVSMEVDKALIRNLPKWRLKNACSACTYKLQHEPDLTFKMLFTMDGNNSLKRLRNAHKSPPVEEGSQPSLGPSNKRHDPRSVPGDRYLTRDKVDRWARSELANHLAPHAPQLDEDNPCESRWTNMMDDVTAKMWGIFDETGVFLALCRHGFSLVIADMVASGELSKYPLAVIAALLEAFGEDLAGGYDIGCKFKTTLAKSALGPLAAQLKFKSLVGSFHGHAHNRLCQLSHLATYVKGLGLEDLEGCERFFLKSNALAPSVRYTSVFHRKQKILEYLEHSDAFETQYSLSTFLVNNYQQSLEILDGEDALHTAMTQQGIAGVEVFHRWLEEERSYLCSLAKEPIEETLEMDYYQKLVNLYATREQLDKIKGNWISFESQDGAPKPSGSKRQRRPDTTARHLQENYDNALEAVHALELKLKILMRWTPNDIDWKRAATMVAQRRYRRCLDELERLVVSQMFELTKMNMSQTGYKLRRHIGQALQTRSHAIRNALTHYNAAAALLSPPRPSISWNQVVEYAFLADFDLLRDCREDISTREWARPAARLLMDQYFKIERAREEIQRLNIEIKRVITHMRDEELYLSAKEQEAALQDPALSWQIRRYRDERTRFYDIHRRRFKKLAANPRFTGSILPGTPIDTSLIALNSRMGTTPVCASVEDKDDSEEEEDEEGEEGEEEDVKEISDALEILNSA